MAKSKDHKKKPAQDIVVPKAASADLVWQGVDTQLPYRATAGHVDVRADDGKLIGKMFYLAFVALQDGKPNPQRPVTFAYNGGPGSCSVPIDFGGIGPKRVRPNGLDHIPASSPLEDNPHSILAATDLVFLDALSTGWSRVAEGVEDKQVFGIDADADCFARAISAWLQDNDRWSSPVYLYGESYGTVRNSVLMRLLGERSIKLTGVVMLSAIFDWAQVQPGSDAYYLGMMPTYAATAQHFGRAGKGVDVDEWFDQAMDFTEEVLAPALLKGDRLSAEREREVAERLSDFIGIPVKHILDKHLRIDLTDFRSTLLADERKVCGRLDTRFVSDAPSFVQTSNLWVAGEDASDDAVDSAWVSAFRAFCSDVLGYRSPARYMGNNYAKTMVSWIWRHDMPGTEETADAPNVALDIAVAMRRDPTIKLAIIGGRYDAATTWWNVAHDMSCQFLSDELKGRIVWHRYGCGHMAYVDEATNEAMGADMRAFYAMR
jgi:carboxypeptidase C (cathepsin A)